MLSIKLESIKVDFNLDNGLYILGTNSSTGKSYLCNLLKSYEYESDDVIAVTYNDINGLNRLKSLGDNAKVILLDRFNLYYSEELFQKVKKLAENSIVLLDFKNPFFSYNLACIEFGKDHMEVFG